MKHISTQLQAEICRCIDFRSPDSDGRQSFNEALEEVEEE